MASNNQKNNILKKSISLIMFLGILFLYSCRKKPDAVPVVPVVPANEFIDLTLNGVNYSWKNTDSLYGARVEFSEWAVLYYNTWSYSLEHHSIEID